MGKVLGDDNSGPNSGIIAGMEWAARTEHAKVINMSLGIGIYHTQDDPMSQAVNKLTAETGALFVIAAGNEGTDPYSVSAPGTADAALTVGSVDSSDVLAYNSGAGPRLKDDGLKPDLTAPGVEVLAARSQYMTGGEGYYRTESGTSMAAPHVAGAAVLLAQKHPEWSGQQIKDALMSTSAPTPAYTPTRRAPVVWTSAPPTCTTRSSRPGPWTSGWCAGPRTTNTIRSSGRSPTPTPRTAP